jgi:hypothetical protein
MGKVIENLPSSGFDPGHLKIPENIQLADPLFNQKSEIDLLLGSDIFWNLLCIGQIKLGKNKPTLQKTKFGWIISGPIPNYSNIHNNIFLSNINIHEKIHNEISKFWEIEIAKIINLHYRKKKHFVKIILLRPLNDTKAVN